MSDLKEGEYIVPFGGQMKPQEVPADFQDRETCKQKAKEMVTEAIGLLRAYADEIAHWPGHHEAQGAKSDLEAFAAHLEGVTLKGL